LTLLFLVAQLTDQWIFHHFAYPGLYDRAWWRMLRFPGYVPLWGIVAIALFLQDWEPRARRLWRAASRRGLLLFGSAALGGMAAEVLKLAFRRERPRLTDGAYVLRAWSDRPFSTGDFGLPSSEAAVAFAAATMLSCLLPRGRILWYSLALGCAVPRVASGAHFASDVAMGALVGYVVAFLLWQRGGPARETGGGSPEP
jgi:undecaprenyl-diphosphatase